MGDRGAGAKPGPGGHTILERAAPVLEDARWYAILTQCEYILDCWALEAGRLRYEWHLTEEEQARVLL
ncbi:hypothetical protein MFU01_74550 [Myxococcus fulvus]|uniref:Uncharacterized protein n=1 Tax=Myxococcus fulvus TaxID=33 RepID=A0A511TGU1_MYXFU|nr:hypothetical protein MFU01_74550 [Myxococcus fulvus]